MNVAMLDVEVLLSNFVRDESGQDLIEYALIAAMIGLGAVAAMSRLAEQIISAFNSIGRQLTNAL